MKVTIVLLNSIKTFSNNSEKYNRKNLAEIKNDHPRVHIPCKLQNSFLFEEHLARTRIA